MADNAPPWLEPLCQIAAVSKSSNVPIRELFTRAAPNLDDPEFVERVRGKLSSDPVLIQSWQRYSYDKRGTPSPYLDGLAVGFADLVDGKLQTRDDRRHVNAQEACADFIHRETMWVLKRQQPATDTRPSA